MTYFFPFGFTSTTAINATTAATAITASFTASLNSVITSTYYTDFPPANTGASGSVGPTHTSASCAATNPGVGAPRGPSGSIGPSGSQGPSLISCPAGSVLCSGLTPPAGYSIVCIQTGSCTTTVVCPDTLP